MTEPMKAVSIDGFGAPDRLRICDRPRPKLAPDGVLIRVAAAGVNPVDWKICAGRLEAAFPHVFPLIPGFDAAGHVEAVGAAVTRFVPGDAVFGYLRKHFIGEGTYAEFVTAPEDIVEMAPRTIGIMDAAGVPTCALSAYQAISGPLAASAGDVVAIGGAAGGVGGFAVQMAAASGARVIGLASAANHDYVRSLGAADVIDYHDADVAGMLRGAAGDGGVDAALDVIGGDGLATLMEAVRPSGRIVSFVDQGVKAKAAEHRLTGTYVFGRAVPGHLAHIASEIEAGRLSVRTEVVPLSDAAEAHRRSASGHAHGKIVLAISD